MPTGRNSKGELVSSTTVIKKLLALAQGPILASITQARHRVRAVSLTFDITELGHKGRTLSADSPVIKIGTLQSSTIRIRDDHASRMHAVIENKGYETILIDLGSTVGTKVNGGPIRKIALCNDDVIQIGTTIIVIDGINNATTQTQES